MTTAVMHAKTVELLNADYQPLARVSLQKAARLLSLGKAIVEEADESGRLLREWFWPKIIRLVKQAKVSYERIYAKAIISKRGVLIRDGYRCAYCEGKADTIDHVLPRSRGGLNTWENLVACCFRCNNKKDNKTPKEARMHLKITPYAPSRIELRSKAMT